VSQLPSVGSRFLHPIEYALMLRGFFVTAAAALVSITNGAAAQQGTPVRTAGPGEIRGKLVDSASGQAVTSGSVAVRRVGDSVFVSGALPKEDGSFRVDGLRSGRYTVRVRAIGFAPVVRNDIAITADHPAVDLGAIGLNAVAAKLEATQTVAEREDVVLAPDRTNYSVKNMPVASGGTAVDVLRNIPLVEVDGSNNVSLRGNANVVIQINGRSTPLKGDQLGAFLAQLPAGTVK
jgi:ferric enterobactin receptor